MAYNSIHTGPEIDAAVTLLGDIQDARDATAADRQAVEQVAPEVAANAQIAADAVATTTADRVAAQQAAQQAQASATEVSGNTKAAEDAAQAATEMQQLAEQAAQAAENDANTASQRAVETEQHADQVAQDAVISQQARDEAVQSAAGLADAVQSAAADAVRAKSSADSAAAIVTGGTASLTPEPGKIPLADGEATIDIEWLGKDIAALLRMSSPTVNHIGIPGRSGFGVGICPIPHPEMSQLPGTLLLGSAEYGNYRYSDGSIMVWVPAFFYRYGHPDNPTYAEYGVNSVDVLPRSAFPNLITAGIHGYTLHRAFYDDGVEQPGVFVDKYLASNNGGTASSIKMGDPLSSNSAHNPFSGLTGSPPNNYSGAIDSAKTRGADFFSSSLFIFKAAALLSLAHAQAATSTAACAWYDPTGVTNFPKGCNNNALRDTNDTSVLYASDGYSNAAKTGSGEPFAKTTHNGQECGIADLNGGMWEICLGLTYLDGNYHILRTDARMADLTPGITLATDAWGAAGVAANYDVLGPTHGSLGTGPGTNRAIGSANYAVLSSATSGLDWAGACAGIPLADGVGGTNLFGNDRLYDNNPTHLCAIAGATWSSGVYAGVWALHCRGSRPGSSSDVGFRAALYLVRRSDSEGDAE